MGKVVYVMILLMCCVTVFSAPSKTDKQRAAALGKSANSRISVRDYATARKKLELAHKLDPTTFYYPFEIGCVYTQTQEYDMASQWFHKAVGCEDATEQCYVMYGNALYLAGKKEEAESVYQAGVARFPNSGVLFYSLGNASQSNDMLKAMEYYELGVRHAPAYKMNYYWLAKIFCSTTEKIWGLLYGEIFVNMEREGERSAEIKKLLYDTYKECISYSGDSLAVVKFYNNSFTYKNERKADVLPLTMVFEPCMEKAVVVGEKINLKSLNRIRKEFIRFYYADNYNISHPCVLFEWHKRMIDEGMFEAYNYWLLGKGDGADFAIWQAHHDVEYDLFVEWFKHNQLRIGVGNEFHRYD